MGQHQHLFLGLAGEECLHHFQLTGIQSGIHFAQGLGIFSLFSHFPAEPRQGISLAGREDKAEDVRFFFPVLPPEGGIIADVIQILPTTHPRHFPQIVGDKAHRPFFGEGPVHIGRKRLPEEKQLALKVHAFIILFPAALIHKDDVQRLAGIITGAALLHHRGGAGVKIRQTLPALFRQQIQPASLAVPLQEGALAPIPVLFVKGIGNHPGAYPLALQHLLAVVGRLTQAGGALDAVEGCNLPHPLMGPLPAAEGADLFQIFFHCGSLLALDEKGPAYSGPF